MATARPSGPSPIRRRTSASPTPPTMPASTPCFNSRRNMRASSIWSIGDCVWPPLGHTQSPRSRGQWQGTPKKWRPSWKNSCSTVAPAFSVAPFSRVIAYKVARARARTSQVHAGMAMGSGAVVASVVVSNGNHLLPVAVAVFVARQGMPVDAEVAVHASLAGPGLVVAVDDEPGDARIGAQVGTRAGVDVGVGCRPVCNLRRDPVDENPGEQEVGRDH